MHVVPLACYRLFCVHVLPYLVTSGPPSFSSQLPLPVGRPGSRTFTPPPRVTIRLLAVSFIVRQVSAPTRTVGVRMRVGTGIYDLRWFTIRRNVRWPHEL